MALTPIPESELVSMDLFADETCTTQHRYMAIGCVACTTRAAGTLAESVVALKSRLGLPHEMKWENVSRRNVERYMQIVDLLAGHIAANRMHFHALVIDTSKLDHGQYNHGSNEIGFNKFVFQILAKCARLYRPRAKFRVALDSRDTVHPLSPIRDMLNFNARNKFGMPHFPYRRLQFEDSKKSPMIQVADVLIGAVGYRTNGKHIMQGPAAPKAIMSDHVQRAVAVADLGRPTPHGGKFTIWHMRLRAASHGPRY